MAAVTPAPPSTESTSQSTGSMKPPKSKTEPYYSISPLWTDVTPIPQIDLESPSTKIPGVTPTTGPALATIQYTPRYAEAMSYLRAIMAANEFSERALALTEDVIGMNAAHYTVWLYRFRVLRELWGIGGDDFKPEGKRTDVSKKALEGVDAELGWLESVSQRSLKNYQIWHHRHSLVDLLPALPKDELDFLHNILSFDTKNYHVWSYRQWLCTRFPDPLLTTSIELQNTESMLADDVRNNSAWNHRYFVCFGHKELAEINAKTAGLRGKDFQMDVVDLEVVEREMEFAKERIRWAPQNGSAWNYLKGMMKHGGIDVNETKDFAAEFVGENFDFETENKEGEMRGVRSSHAIEMLIDVFEKEGGEDGRRKVREGFGALSTKWDPIRRKYWDYRLKKLEDQWKGEDALA